MCGITGFVALSEQSNKLLANVIDSTNTLNQRGPDFQSTYQHKNIALGHARLSIIDTSSNGNQPFSDESGRYTIVFNGEFYNYLEHRKQLEDKGVSFKSNSDTEVLLQLYIHYKEDCLQKIDGFFAFVIFDKEENSLFIARDRMGIKPLLYYFDGDKFAFASEMKALFPYNIKREIDTISLFTYLQLNYIPEPNSIFENVKKLTPGTYLKIGNIDKFELPEETKYYEISSSEDNIIDATTETYSKAQVKLRDLMYDSVENRLVADVPVGTFLSGGVDSSIITSIASKLKNNISSFSVGYKDEPMFDETKYAQIAAKRYKTDHHVFKLTNNDLEEHLQKVLDYIDEPFADSSCIPVYILAEKTKQHVKVALSGDGADEMFSGYNKHYAEYKARNSGIQGLLLKTLNPVLKQFPTSRNGKLSNLNRKLIRFGDGLKLSPKERYWTWAALTSEEDANYLIKESENKNFQRLSDDAYEYKKRKEKILLAIKKGGSINDVLYTDMHLVLRNDMLKKVDLMSMANSLEVRTPFLDHKIVDFAFSLPSVFKINTSTRKKILKDSFRSDLPDELFNRPKHGFEVPLLKWFNGSLKSKIETEWLSEEFIQSQGVFNYEAIRLLKNKLYSSSPGDATGTIWALIVFQNWWKKYMN
jgi:asparagine synthase (glutamine-hydrolysing)